MLRYLGLNVFLPLVFHNVRCKVCSTIDRKPCLLAPKWDTLMKHENKKKAIKEFLKLNVKKRD
jgi:hypothetical protein